MIDRRIGLLVAIGVACVLAGPAQAQDQAAIDRCHSRQNTMEIVDCLGQVSVQADRHLNAAYQKALKGIDPAGVAALRTSERAWLEYRNQRCSSISAGDGTIMRVVFADCM